MANKIFGIGTPAVARDNGASRLKKRTKIDLMPPQPITSRPVYFGDGIPGKPAFEDPYNEIGDCYNRNQGTAMRWEIRDSNSMPYLSAIKALIPSYRSLQYLVDWMQVSTTPTRWKIVRHGESEERVNRTQIALIKRSSSGQVVVHHISQVDELRQALRTIPSDTATPTAVHQQKLRIFLLEDLSRSSIELLGSAFTIDPHFFREQLNEHVWYNTRDPWAEAPQVFSIKKRRKWFQIRNVRLRYHESKDNFAFSRNQADRFNVVRRPDNDGSTWSYRDAKDSVVSITCTRTSIWIGKGKGPDEGPVGIVLVDPTIGGRPLWYDRANWLAIPGFDNSSTSPPLMRSESWYKDIVYMSLEYPWFERSASADAVDLGRVVLPTLYTVSAEWLLVCNYANTRVSQIEWELEMPSLSKARSPSVDDALKKMSTWRHQIPIWREMVLETLEDAIPVAFRLTTRNASQSVLDAFEDLKVDFNRILRKLEELQTRVNNLSDRGNAEMQLAAAREQYEAAQKGLEESRNLARLTWLATIFIPMTFVSGLFSMTDNVGSMTDTFRIYFAAAIPLAVICLVIARWGSHIVQMAVNKLKSS